MLTRSENKGWENFFVPELTISMIKYLSFGRSLESIKSCDFNDPVPIDEPGLLHHILLGSVGPLNPARVQVEDLERLAMVPQRSQEAVYYEWARLFSHRIVQIIKNSVTERVGFHFKKKIFFKEKMKHKDLSIILIILINNDYL